MIKSLRTKFLTTGIIVSGIIASSLYFYLSTHESNKQFQIANRKAGTAFNCIAANLYNNIDDTTESMLLGLSGVRYYVAADDSNKPIKSFSFETAEENSYLDSNNFQPTIRNNIFQKSFPIKLNNSKTGTIYIGISLSDVDSLQENKIFLLASLVVFLSGIWLSVFLSSLMIRKINKIAAGIKIVKENTLPHKMETSWKDEFMPLANSFNFLIDELETSNNQIAALNKRLGDTFKEKVKELGYEINKRTAVETALTQSEEQFRLLVELAPVGMVVTSLENIITKVNKAFSDMLDYENYELLKMSLDKITFKDDWAKEKFLYSRLLRNQLDALSDWPETNEEDWENKLMVNKKMLSDNLSDIYFEKRFIHKSGKIIYGIVKSILLRDRNGKPLNFVSQVIDITDRKMVEKELIKAKDRAEESDRLKSTFLAQMSHEIRTPLNVILNVTPILKDEPAIQKDEELITLMDSMNSAGKRLQRTIDLILNMSSIQSGNYEVDFKVVDTAKQLGRLTKEFKSMCAEKGLEINFESKVKDPKIMADEYSFTQIFENLINNSIKYTHRGNICIKIYEDEREKINIAVKDTGIGISEDYLEKIFTPFSQEDVGQKREFEGNGLGLALVKKYVELNKANIKVESAKGIGSTFTVTFNRQNLN